MADESSQYPYAQFFSRIHNNIIFPSPKWFLPFRFSSKILYPFIISSVCATCSAHPVFHDLIILISDEYQKLCTCFEQLNLLPSTFLTCAFWWYTCPCRPGTASAGTLGRCFHLFEGSSMAGLGRLGTSGSIFSLPSSCFSCPGGGTGATLFDCCALSWLNSASGFIWGVVDLWPDACRQEQQIKGTFYLLFYKST